MKKTIWSALALILMASFFVGCQKEGNNPAPYFNQPSTIFSRMGSSMDAVNVNSSNYQKVEVVPLVRPDASSAYVSGKIDYIENGNVTASVEFNSNGSAIYSSQGGNRSMAFYFEDDDTYWIITDPLVKPANCDYIVAGTIEFFDRYDGQWEATVDFGDGTCDPYFTLADDGDTVQLNINDIDECDNHDDDYYEEDCLDYVYPIDVQLPDGTVLTANSEDDLENIFETWDNNNPNATAEPSLVFPLSIIWEEDGTVETVASEAELEELWKECEDDYYDDCPELVFPIDVILPDGTVQTAQHADQLQVIFLNWEWNNPNSPLEPQLVFPITVSYEDGSTATALDEDELEELLDDCYPYDDTEDCFNLVFPVSVLFPDGTAVQAQDEDDLEMIIEAWYTNNPNTTQEPSLVFPVSVIYEDGTTDVANDEDELEQLYDECDDEGRIGRRGNRVNAIRGLR